MGPASTSELSQVSALLRSQLHDELISRGRRIEFELGVGAGQFRGRPKSWRFVKHDVATLMVYLATLGAWIVAGIVLGAR
jgi:hypothetical protein